MLFEKPDIRDQKPDIGTAKQDFETLNRTLTFIKHDEQFQNQIKQNLRRSKQ